MADQEPSRERREHVLQALTRAQDQETASYQAAQGGQKPGKGNREKTKWTVDDDSGEPKTARQIIASCVQLDQTVLKNKIIYFMFNVGAAGAMPYLSMYGLQLGLPIWHIGLIVGAGLLAGTLITPLLGFFADKHRWHRGMFLTVVCLWVAFTLAAVFYPQPDRVSCEVAKSQLLEVFSEDCRNMESIPKSHGTVYYEQMARFPISLQIPPQPCTINIMQICPLEVNEADTITSLGVDSTTEPPTSQTNSSNPISSTPPPTPYPKPTHTKEQELKTQQPRTSNLTKPLRQPLRDTHLGWLYNQTSLQRTSVVVFVFTAVGAVSQMSSLSLVDAATLVALGEARRNRYGWQRSFGTMGFALSSLIVGVMLHNMRETKYPCGLEFEKTNYCIGGVVFAGFMVIGVVVSGFLEYKHSDLSSQHTLKNVTESVFSMNYGSVFVTAFVLSLCNGALYTLLLWHLHIIGATPILLGAGIAMHALADVVTSYSTAWIVKKAGYHIPLVVGIAGYCVTFFCYAMMSRPGWLVVVEIIHGASFAITLNAMTSFLASSVALVSLATTQGLLSGVYWGLGPAVGTALFGYLVDVIGMTLSFYALSLTCLVYLLIFLIWNRDDLPLIDKYLPGNYQPLTSSN